MKGEEGCEEAGEQEFAAEAEGLDVEGDLSGNGR